MVKRFLAGCLVTVLLSAGISWFVTQKQREFSTEFSSELYSDGEWIYSIDCNTDGSTVRIFRCYPDGSELSAIEADVELSDSQYEYDRIIDNETTDDIYVHALEVETASTFVRKEVIFRCDFENFRLEQVLEVPIGAEKMKRENMMISAFRIYGDTVEYLSDDNEEGAIYVLRRSIAETAGDNVEKLRTIEFDRYYDDYDNYVSEYSKKRDTVWYTAEDFWFDTSGAVRAFSSSEGVYLEKEPGVLKSAVKLPKAGTTYIEPVWREDEVTWTDPVGKKVFSYDYESGETVTEDMTEVYNASFAGQDSGYKITPDMLNGLADYGEEGFIAYTELPDDKTDDGEISFRCGLAVSENGRDIKVYPSLSCSETYLKSVFVSNMLGMTVILGIIFLLFFTLYAVKEIAGCVSLRFEMAVVSVVLFGLALSLATRSISRTMTAFYLSNYEKTLTAIQNEIFDELDVYIDSYPDFNSDTLYSEDFINGLLYGITVEYAYFNPYSEKYESAPAVVFHVKDKNGNLIVLGRSKYQNNIPTSYLYENSYIEQEFSKAYNADLSASHIVTNRYDADGAWYVQLCHYHNDKYNVDGILEIEIENYVTNWRIREFMTRIIRLLLLLFVLMAGVTIAYLGGSLSPIRRLNRQIKRGDIEKPVLGKQGVEIADIWERLYVMLSNAHSRRERIEKNNREHYRFISHDLVKMLGPEELADAVPETSRKFSAVVVCAVFREQEKGACAEFLGYVPKAVSQCGGVLLDMDRHHAVWLFTGRNDEVLTAVERIRMTARECGISLGAGIGSGIITLCVQGTQDCACITADGEEVLSAYRLAERAEKTGGYICLLTESAVSVTDSTYWTVEQTVDGEGALCFTLTERVPEQETEEQKV